MNHSRGKSVPPRERLFHCAPRRRQHMMAKSFLVSVFIRPGFFLFRFPRRETMCGRCAPCLAGWCGFVFAAPLALLVVACGKPPARPALPESSAGEDPYHPAPSSDTTRTLSQDETSYIWDLEHHGNLLVKYGFKTMADALVKADRTALLALLAVDFSGQTLDKPHEVRM